MRRPASTPPSMTVKEICFSLTLRSGRLTACVRLLIFSAAAGIAAWIAIHFYRYEKLTPLQVEAAQ